MIRRFSCIMLALLLIAAAVTVFPGNVWCEDGTGEGGDEQDTGTVAQDEPSQSAPLGPLVSYYKGEVVKVVTLTRNEDESLSPGEIRQECMVEILSGPFRGRIYQINVSGYESSVDFRQYETGDHIMVACEIDSKSSDIKNIYIYDYYRVDYLTVFAVLALIVILIIGFTAGIRFTVSVLLFALSYQFFFVPMMLSGYSPIILIIPICLAIMVINVFHELRFTRAGLIAFTGTFLTILVASLLGLFAEKTANLNGLGDSELALLQYMPGHTAIDLSGLTFALAMLMSLGAAMSVSCTICTEMAEAREMNQYISRMDLFRYGMHTGRNILSRSLLSLFFASLVSVIPSWIVYSGYRTLRYMAPVST